jgi:hypothetical protein
LANYVAGLVLVKTDYRNSVRLSPDSCILRRFQAIVQESFDASPPYSQIHQTREALEWRSAAANAIAAELARRAANSFRTN